MTCKNCDTPLQGDFCINCGQKATVERINLPNFIEEISTSVFQVDRGFFFTLKTLFISPGHGISDFLEGKRKDFFKPIAYVLLLSTLYFFVTKLTGANTWVADAILGMQEGAADSESGFEVPSPIQWLADNYAYTTLLMLPVFSAATFIAFLGFKKNYLEHVVLNSYITGQQAIFYSFSALTKLVSDSEILELIPFIISIGYTTWVFIQFFKDENRYIIILRTIATYVIYLVFIFIITFILLGFSNGFDF